MSKLTEAAAITDRALAEAEHALSVLRTFSMAIRQTDGSRGDVNGLLFKIASAKRAANLCKQLCDQVEQKLGDQR